MKVLRIRFVFLTVFHLVVLGQVVQVAVLHGDHVVQLCSRKKEYGLA